MSGSVVITGAAGGIGSALARRLHDRGRHVILVDLDDRARRLADELGTGTARAEQIDATNPADWSAGLERCVAWGGEIDALVTCAGILGHEHSVAELPLAEWLQVLHVNLTGTFVSCQAVLPRMVAAGHGRIVTLASIAGKEGNPGQAAYSASKGGVIAFTKALAKEVATAGITVNSIAPTIVDGPFAAAMSDQVRETIRSKIPIGRFGRPEEVAELVAWIISPECSFTTGFCFDLSGGRATY